MSSILLKNATIINENATSLRDILIQNGHIEKIGVNISADDSYEIIDCKGNIVIPGCIDDQVHFRDPGATYKADIASEAEAAVLGGVTSFMDMPNNNPPAITNEDIRKKKEKARSTSYANYAFYLGATPDNIEEIKTLNPSEICGVKVFMGSSTGNLLVDDEAHLREIFSNSQIPIATHCEDNGIINANLKAFREKYGDENLTAAMHPLIRSREACLKSSKLAISIAKETGANLHVLHLSTKEELELFKPYANLPIEQRKITCEVCAHHMFFNDTWYQRLGNKLKCNPAVKTEADRKALVEAVRSGVITCIATDHAPHTLEEKMLPYIKAPGGLPLIQFSLLSLLELVHRGELSIEDVVTGYCHNPALRFHVQKRGFIREGYWADLVVIKPHSPIQVTPNMIASKCGWSPFVGMTFNNRILHTFVNGNHIVNDGKLVRKNPFGMALEFSC